MGKTQAFRGIDYGFIPVKRTAYAGQRVTLYNNGRGCVLCRLSFISTNHWRAAGLAVLVQQWRWLRLMWGR